MKYSKKDHLKLQFALFALVVFATSCSLKSQGTASVSVKVPAKPASAMISQVSGAMSGTMSTSLPPPMALGDVNCLLVNVIAADIPPALWDNGGKSSNVDYKVKVEKALLGEPCGYAGVTSKVVPFSNTSTLNVNVPIGKDRVFQLLGFKAPSGSCTVEVDAQVFFNGMSGKVTPTELGRVIASVSGSMSLNLSGRYDSTRNMDHCSVDDDHGGPEWFFDPVHKVASGKPIRSAAYGSSKYFLFQRASDNNLEVLRINENGTMPITGNLGSGASPSSYDITVDLNGVPIVVYTFTNQAYVKKMLSDSSWTGITNPGTTPYSIVNCRISTDSMAKLFLACHQGTAYPVPINYWNGSGWVGFSSSLTGANGSTNLEVQVGYDDKLVVAYQSSSSIKISKVMSDTTIAGTTTTGFTFATAAGLALVLKQDGNPIVAVKDGADIKVGDCMSNCFGSGDSWTSRNISGYTALSSNFVMKMNMNWEPVVLFYADAAGTNRVHIQRLNVAGGFVWQYLQDPSWMTPSDHPAAGNALTINTNALGLAIDDFGNVQSIISHPSTGTAYIKF